MDHQRKILRLAFAFDQDSRLPWNTILHSCVKKSGKTMLNGALALPCAATQEEPNEILILATILSNPLARVFKNMVSLQLYSFPQYGCSPITAESTDDNLLGLLALSLKLGN